MLLSRAFASLHVEGAFATQLLPWLAQWVGPLRAPFPPTVYPLPLRIIMCAMPWSGQGGPVRAARLLAPCLYVAWCVVWRRCGLCCCCCRGCSTQAWQRGCPELIVGLTARPVWYSCSGRTPGAPPLDPRLAWVADLEARFEEIKREVLALRTADGAAVGFQQYRTPTWTDAEVS
jgi:hypothetical protein